MNDPWDVKSVRRPHQYQSFMKINGVPLLPPVLSKECRKEMQYYKLLAKEVEKRIKTLRPYVEMEPEVSGAPELEEAKDKIDEAACLIDRYCHPTTTYKENVYKTINSNVTIRSAEPMDKTMNMMFGFNVSIRNATRREDSCSTRGRATIELPERDYNCPKKPEGMLLTELNQAIKNSERKPMLKRGDGEVDQALRKNEKGQVMGKKTVLTKASTKPEPEINKALEDPDMTLRQNDLKINDISFSKEEFSQLSKTCYDNTDEEFTQYTIEGPSLRSFTGSLHDINADCLRDTSSTLVRQRSYTVLKPSPLLIQHLQLQARNTGVDLKLISMSESLSNIPQLQKKKRRRSWDLETAKSQWSSMALDLKKNTKPRVTLNSNGKTSAKQRSPSPYLAQSAGKCRKPISRYTKSPKSDPIQRSKFGLNKVNVSEKSNLKDIKPGAAANKNDRNGGLKSSAQTKESPPKINDRTISAANDPATKVRELYEKIQKQQLDQMATLVEKQKQEQLLLHQVFEEQNNMLFKQLKSICPEPTVEIKQAWCDKDQNAERGPVSLSQLINHSPIASAPQSPGAKTLGLQSSVSVSPAAAFTSLSTYSHSGEKAKRSNQMSHIKHNRCARPRTNVTENNTARKLNYNDSGMTSDIEPLLTDRTNDTMADLNVTFPTDYSDEIRSCENSPRRSSANLPGIIHRRKINSSKKCTDNAIRSLENSIQKTMYAVTLNQRTLVSSTPQEREAATKIVAYAKGYLVRRLMRTERVQATVATIHDALLCALQLHQDREGIRGADVDLHRRLIQQITAACYNLHDTFITSSAAERCSVIAADRVRRRVLASRPPSSRGSKQEEQAQERFGPYPPSRRPSTSSIVTQANNETVNVEKSRAASRRHDTSPIRRAWRN